MDRNAMLDEMAYRAWLVRQQSPLMSDLPRERWEGQPDWYRESIRKEQESTLDYVTLTIASRIRALHPILKWYISPCDHDNCSVELVETDSGDRYHADTYTLFCEACTTVEQIEAGRAASYPCKTVRELDRIETAILGRLV